MPIDAQRWQRLSPWLDQLLERPPAERSAWLADLAAREPALAADLRGLLERDAALAEADLPWAAAPAAMPALAPPPLAGQRIGAYTLVEPLGEGGMGAVWLA